jgi:hypothetical protein
VKNHTAINPSDLPKRSAFEYVWWQTLWLAFVWQSNEPLSDPDTFVQSLFEPKTPTSESFRHFVREDTWSKLLSIYQDGSITEDSICESMNLIAVAVGRPKGAESVESGEAKICAESDVEQKHAAIDMPTANSATDPMAESMDQVVKSTDQVAGSTNLVARSTDRVARSTDWVARSTDKLAVATKKKDKLG